MTDAELGNGAGARLLAPNPLIFAERDCQGFLW